MLNKRLFLWMLGLVACCDAYASVFYIAGRCFGLDPVACHNLVINGNNNNNNHGNNNPGAGNNIGSGAVPDIVNVKYTQDPIVTTPTDIADQDAITNIYPGESINLSFDVNHHENDINVAVLDSSIISAESTICTTTECTYTLTVHAAGVTSVYIRDGSAIKYQFDINVLALQDMEVEVQNLSTKIPGATEKAWCTTDADSWPAIVFNNAPAASDATIEYRLSNNDNWATNPAEITMAGAGEYTIYYKITARGYNTKESSYTCTLNQPSVSVTIKDSSAIYAYKLGTDPAPCTSDAFDITPANTEVSYQFYNHDTGIVDTPAAPGIYRVTPSAVGCDTCSYTEISCNVVVWDPEKIIPTNLIDKASVYPVTSNGGQLCNCRIDSEIDWDSSYNASYASFVNTYPQNQIKCSPGDECSFWIYANISSPVQSRYAYKCQCQRPESE